MTVSESTRPVSEPVTVIVSRLVRPGAEAAFEEWLNGICREAARFEGHQGVSVQRRPANGRSEYVLIFRFDADEHLRDWNRSAVRAEWLERARPLTLEEPRSQVITGLEHWFPLPDRPVAGPPPRHKMALLTWLVIFPMVVVLTAALKPLLGGLPAWIQTLIVTGVLVALMTYVVMPAITRWFAAWLFTGGRPAAPRPLR